MGIIDKIKRFDISDPAARRTTSIIIGLIIGLAGNYILKSYVGNVLATIITLYGCYLWVKLKNRHWCFMFWGLLTPIGLFGISLLKDKSKIEGVNDGQFYKKSVARS